MASSCEQGVDDSETRLDELFSQTPIGIASGESAIEQCNSPPKQFGVPVSDEDVKFAQAIAVPGRGQGEGRERGEREEGERRDSVTLSC